VIWAEDTIDNENMNRKRSNSNFYSLSKSLLHFPQAKAYR